MVSAGRIRKGRAPVRWPCALLLVLLLAAAAPAAASYNYGIAPGAVDNADIRVGLGNPALLVYHGSTILFGYHDHYVNFLENGSLRTYSLAYHSPYWFRGAGIAAQFFRSSTFKEGVISAAYGFEVGPQFALGLRADLLTRSYSSSGFAGVDYDDPLLAENSALGFGVGIGGAFFPTPRLAIGAYALNLNSPNMSMGGGSDPLPPEIHTEVQFDVGSLVPGVRFVYVEGEPYVNFYTKTHPYYGLSLFGEGGTESFRFGASLVFGRSESPMGFGVRYEHTLPKSDLSTYSSGDREVAVAVMFDRVITLPSLDPMGEFRADLLPVGIALDSRYFASLDADSLEYIERRIVREIDPAVPRAAINTLTWDQVARMDTCCDPPFRKPAPERVAIEEPPLPRPMIGLVSGDYEAAIETLQTVVQAREWEDEERQLKIVVDPGFEERASHVRELLEPEEEEWRTESPGLAIFLPGDQEEGPVGESELDTLERWFCMSDSVIAFRILQLTPSPYRGDWQLVVSDSDDKEVWRHSGSGRMPREIIWDWRGSDGEFIQPDHYFYKLSYSNRFGDTIESKRYHFFVKKTLYSTTVEIRKSPVLIDWEDDNLELRLKSPGPGAAVPIPSGGVKRALPEN